MGNDSAIPEHEHGAAEGSLMPCVACEGEQHDGDRCEQCGLVMTCLEGGGFVRQLIDESEAIEAIVEYAKRQYKAYDRCYAQGRALKCHEDAAWMRATDDVETAAKILIRVEERAP